MNRRDTNDDDADCRRPRVGARRPLAVLFALIALILVYPAHAAIPATERQVLLDLYGGTNGAAWTRSTNWNGPAGSECTWFGVFCDTGSSHVLAIRLPNNRLSGTLPALAALTELGDFEVFTNQLSGPIPSLNGLIKLQAFYAYDNRLSGSIPSLSGLGALQYFAVHHNLLTGQIPSISGNTALVYFYVSENLLSGPIPTISGLGSLTDFFVHTNQLTGSLPALSGLTQLRYFYAHENQLTGTLPALGGLSALRVFSVYRNQLSGSIPALGGNPALSVFFAFRNGLSGPIPALSSLTELDDFEVFDNQLTGTIPSLAGLSKLRAFYVYNNLLTGTVPSLSGLGALQYFSVHQNRLTGQLPSLSGNPDLRYFYAYDNQLTGPLPSLSGLTELTDFVVSDNQLSGTIPSLGAVTKLKYFYVYDNQLSGSIPDLGGLTSLQHFAIENNQLSGTIPALAGLSALQDFYVYGNQLSGAIPAPPSPSSLVAGRSRLCPNALDHLDNAGWDAATGLSPWYRDCNANGPVTVVGTLQTKSLQTLQASAGSAGYDWAIDGDGVVGRSSSSNSLPLTFPTAFNGNVSVTTTSSSGARSTLTLPLKTEAPRLTVSVTGAPVEDCGNGDGVPQPGKRFSIPITVSNEGSVAIRDGFAVFVPQDRFNAAATGQGIAGKLVVETPLLSIGSLAPGVTSDPLKVTVTLAADAQCGANYGVLFKGGVDGVSFSAGQSNPLATLSVPAAAQCRPYTGSCGDASKAKALVSPRQGLYLNPNRSGNGLSNFIIPVSGAPSVYFGAWFTGGADRNPTWYIIQGPLVGNVAVAPIYKFTRDVNASSFTVNSSVVGQAVVTMKSTEKLALTWQMGDRFGIELMDYFVGGAQVSNNRTGAWYNPNEPGWGQVVHQYDIDGQSNTFVVDYIYDAAGQPRWVLGQAATGEFAAPTTHQTFQVHCPGCVWIADWNNLGKATGNGSEAFIDATHGTATTSFALPAPYPGVWNRSNLPITLLTVPQ